MTARIVADSSCELGPAQARALQITLVPVALRLSSGTFRDGLDLTVEEFYRRLSAEKEVPGSTPPPQSDFEAAFERELAAAPSVLCMTVSGKVSRVFDAAAAAAKRFGERVRVYDTRMVSAGFALMAEAASRLAAEGKNAAEIAARLDVLREKAQGFAIYPDLRYLAKSGRINKAQMALGLMMNAFPVSRVAKSGEMEGEATVRSWEQAKESLVSVAARKIERPADTRIRINHTNAPDLAQFLADGLRERLKAPPKELTVAFAGPVVGANVGPGAGGIFFIEE